MTQHLHRVHIVCPAARCAAANTWIRNNLNPEGGDWLTPRLSATGEAPYTHAECCAALTNAQLKQLLALFASQGGRPLPADWDTRTRAERKTWLATNRDAIDTSIGVYFSLDNNDNSALPSFQSALTHKGVRGPAVDPSVSSAEALVKEGEVIK